MSVQSGSLRLDNQGELRLTEAGANGSSYVSLKAPASLSSSSTYTLPSAVPTTNNQALIAQTNGTMSWSSAVAGSGAWSFVTSQAFSNSSTLSLTGLDGSTDLEYMLIISNGTYTVANPKSDSSYLSISLGGGTQTWGWNDTTGNYQTSVAHTPIFYDGLNPATTVVYFSAVIYLSNGNAGYPTVYSSAVYGSTDGSSYPGNQRVTGIRKTNGGITSIYAGNTAYISSYSGTAYLYKIRTS